MSELTRYTAHALADALARGQASSLEATQATLTRIDATVGLGTFLHLDEEGALAQARGSDERRLKGRTLGRLDGIPVAIKDNMLCEGLPATAGSKVLAGFRAPYDATAVRKLKEAGCVILGKLNLDEFAMGSSNEHSAYGPVRNPWDPAHVPGGSSGGCAAAVASGGAYAALGTDTGGSIRQPAAFCGVVGLKPTYGRVSRHGVIAFASSLDQVGPLTKDVTDCGEVLGAIAGHDPRDSTSSCCEVVDFSASLEQGVEGLRLGLPREYFQDGIDPHVRAALEAAIAAYRRLGAVVVEISLPHTAYVIATYYLICTAEASSNLARYDGVRYGAREDPGQGLTQMYHATRGMGFGREVKRRIMLGTYALSAGYYDAYYLRAQRVRTLVQQDFTAAFSQVDVILTPTSPTAAFRLGENIQDPMHMYLADVFTVGCNLTGCPGISLPCGMTPQGLPIGLQLMAPHWQEPLLLRVARAYEREHDWHTRRATS